METILSSEAIDRFQRSLSVNGAPTNTVRAYRADLTGLLTWSGQSEIPLTDLELTAANYLNEMRAAWKPKTTGRKLGTFRTFAEWAGVPGFLAKYKAPKAAEAEPHPIPEGIDGVLRMIEACDWWNRHHRALVALTGLCGLRVGEAIIITPAHVDSQERVIRFRGKGDKERFVPISERAWEYIEPAIQTANIYGGRTLVAMGDRRSRTVLTELAKRAGLSRAVSSHDMRATFATAAYNKSKDLRAVQKLLGHASSKQTELYTGVANEAMRNAAEVA